MSKDVVVLLHGMGEHKEGDMKKDFREGINLSLNQIKGLENADISKRTKIIEINYDSFFEKIRKEMAETSKPIKERLTSIDDLIGLNWGPQMVMQLTAFENKFYDNDFYYTHLLDVYFYITLLGAKVRVDVAKKISKIFKENSPHSNIHFVATSLGTAILHDTLSQLYRHDFSINDDIADLDIQTHRIKSIWMVANVSNLIYKANNISNPFRSIVKPSIEGCVDYYRNIAHILDPFTWIEKFDPQDDGKWIPSEFYEFSYKNIETSAIAKVNTHDFKEYIKNPKVGLEMIRLFISEVPSKENRDDIFEEYKRTTIPGAFDELNDALKSIQLTDIGSIKRFMETAKVFSKIIKDFESQLGA